MQYIMTKGIVQCEHCGFITYYGYQDQDKICHRCNAGFFRFSVNEVRTLDLGKTMINMYTKLTALKNC